MTNELSLFSDAELKIAENVSLLKGKVSSQDNSEIKYFPARAVNQKYVIQPNTITKAIYDMNLGSKRIIMMACSLLLNRNEDGILTAKKDLTVKFRLEDVMKTLNLTHGSTTKKMLEQGIETIFDQKLRIRNDDGWTKIYHWFVSTNYSIEKNGIELTFTPEVANAFIEYLNGYSVINLDVYGNLTGKYSIRMYELCWSYHGFASKASGEWKTPVIGVSEVRTMWQIDDSKYPVMSDFKKRVLDVAKKEINGYENSQFSILEIEPVRDGKRISGWIFHCKMKNQNSEKFSMLSPALTTEDRREIIIREHNSEIIETFNRLLKTYSFSGLSDSERMQKESDILEDAKNVVYEKYKK